MAELILYTVGSEYRLYVPSEYIKVYPCATRGQDDTQKWFNPESKLNTEFHYTHISGNSGIENNSYICQNFVDESGTGAYLNCNGLGLVIDGYYFEIAEDVISGISSFDRPSYFPITNNNIYASIVLDKMPITQGISSIAEKTWVLSSDIPGHSGGQILDKKPSTVNTYIFGGLYFSLNSDVTVGENRKTIKIQLTKNIEGTTYFDRLKIVGRSYTHPAIEGEVPSALSLNYNDSSDAAYKNVNYALEKYSTAAGKGTTATKEAEFVVGQYNATSPNGAKLTVGVGDDASDKQNVLEAGKYSGERYVNVYGKLNLNGRDIGESFVDVTGDTMTGDLKFKSVTGAYGETTINNGQTIYVNPNTREIPEIINNNTQYPGVDYIGGSIVGNNPNTGSVEKTKIPNEYNRASGLFIKGTNTGTTSNTSFNYGIDLQGYGGAAGTSIYGRTNYQEIPGVDNEYSAGVGIKILGDSEKTTGTAETAVYKSGTTGLIIEGKGDDGLKIKGTANATSGDSELKIGVELSTELARVEQYGIDVVPAVKTQNTVYTQVPTDTYSGWKELAYGFTDYDSANGKLVIDRFHFDNNYVDKNNEAKPKLIISNLFNSEIQFMLTKSKTATQEKLNISRKDLYRNPEVVNTNGTKLDTPKPIAGNDIFLFTPIIFTDSRETASSTTEYVLNCHNVFSAPRFNFSGNYPTIADGNFKANSWFSNRPLVLLFDESEYDDDKNEVSGYIKLLGMEGSTSDAAATQVFMGGAPLSFTADIVKAPLPVYYYTLWYKILRRFD